MKKIFIFLLTILTTSAVYTLYYKASFAINIVQNYQQDFKKNLDFFKLSPQHVRYFREATIALNPIEGGAPIVKPQLFDTLFPAGFSLQHGLTMTNKRLEKTYALQVILQNATLSSSRYEFESSLSNTIKNTTLAQIYSQTPVVFEFTQQHSKLLPKLYVEWQDHSFTLGIDPKRPYGDATFYELDMADILSIKHNFTSQKDLSLPDKLTLKKLHKLHDEMVPAMQVLLRFGQINTGWYYRPEKFGTWEPVTSNQHLKFLND